MTTEPGSGASCSSIPSQCADSSTAGVARPLAMAIAALAGFVLSAPSVTFAAPLTWVAAGYTGQVTGAFNTVVKVGQNIQQTAGANAQTPPAFVFTNANNNATAVTTINNGAAISIYSWGTAVAGSTPSSVSWIPVPFTNQPPGVKFLLGKLVYTNGTIVLPTGAFGATLSLTLPGAVDNNNNAVVITGLDLPFKNWDTSNLATGFVGAVKGLAGNNVVDAAGALFDNLGNAIKDNLGNQVIVPGPSFYDTFWSTDYIAFLPGGLFANFSATNDAGTFEKKTAVFDVYGKIVGDPQLEIDSILLDDGSLGSGFSGPEEEEESGTLVWSAVGSGISGVNGVPMLLGTGTLAGGSSNSLDLFNAKPSTAATLVFGLSQLNAPLKGGTLVPTPLLLLTLPTSPAGSASLPFVMPAGLPADIELYFQFWIPDLGATFKFSASNGLKGVTP